MASITYNTQSVGGDLFGNFQTNTYELNDQLSPDVLALSGGGFVCAYSSTNPANGFILLNFFDVHHDAIEPYQTAYIDLDTDAVGRPKLAELSNGNVLVVWDDDNGADGKAGPRASVFTQAGAPVARDIDLTTLDNTAGFTDVDVAALAGGGFVVTYAFGGEIYFRTYDNAGVEQVGFTQVNTITTGTQEDAQVTGLDDGGFAVTWTDTDPADQLVQCRIFEANGSPRTAEFTATPGAGDHSQSSLASTKDGGFVVAYVDTASGEPGTLGAGVALQLISATGVLGAQMDATGATPEDEVDPDVTVLENGFIVANWSTPFTTSTNIIGQTFDAAGAPVGGYIFPGVTAGDSVAPAVSALAGGMYVSSWQDTTTDGSGGSIISQVSEITRNYLGDAAAESFTGDQLRDDMQGLGGDDTLIGAAGDDTIAGGDGEDLILGGSGTDLISGDDLGDTISGGLGNDKIYAGSFFDPGASTFGDELYGDEGVDRIRGSGGADTIDGGSQGDKLNGGAGADLLSGVEGFDKLKGQGGDDTLSGGFQSDTINGGVGADLLYANHVGDVDGSVFGDLLNGANGDDTIHGSGGDDFAVGLAGKDVMNGGSGVDSLQGGTGKDLLRGGLGADKLTGGSDKDTFDYNDVLDSANGAEDYLIDLGNQDIVDLSGIDAKTVNPGDQAFTLVSAFGGNRGELVVVFHAAGTYAGLTTIQGDVDGDAAADFTITIEGDRHNFGHFVF